MPAAIAMRLNVYVGFHVSNADAFTRRLTRRSFATRRCIILTTNFPRVQRPLLQGLGNFAPPPVFV